jgi:hypothetical protein
MENEITEIEIVNPLLVHLQKEDVPLMPAAMKEKVKTSSIINIAVFVLIIIAGGVLSILLPKQKISEVEKRTLTQVPVFTWDTLFHGKYTQKLEDYYADNFPYRENLVAATTTLKENFGYRNNDLMVYHLNSEKPGAGEVNAPDTLAGDIIGDDQDSISAENADTMQNDAEIVKSVMIYKGRAIQIFGGSKASASAYAAMINNYHKVLGHSVKIYCLVIPTPIDFYLPDKYKHVTDAEKKNIAIINSKLDTGIVGVDAYAEVAAHKNEYLYYYTDHHWTGRGAYYAYTGFCKSAGFAPYDLSQFQRKVIHNFLGSLYDLTRDSRLKANIDSVEYFKLPIATKTFIYSNKDIKSCFKSSLFAETARGGNSYSVFLGGDFPLVRVETGIKNGKKLLVIKDSYGNAMAPYFALHYQEVHIVDYRYFNANLVNYIRDKKITDMIFLHNTFVCNSKYTAQHETYLMRMKTVKNPKAQQKDSLAKKTILPKLMPQKTDSLGSKK